MANSANIAVAPSHPLGQGKATPGGHVRAWRACPAFALSHPVTIGQANPWRPNSPGGIFWAAVLASDPKPATVSDLVAIGVKLGLKPAAVQGHLRWLYTWPVGSFQIGGVQYPAMPGAAPVAPAAPAKAGKKVPAKA
jgi:hypothetical protein